MSATLFVVGFAAVCICLSILSCILVGCTSTTHIVYVTLTSSGDPHPSPLLYHFGLSLPSLRPSLPIPFLPTIPPRQSQRQSTLRRGHSELGVNHDGHQGLVGRD